MRIGFAGTPEFSKRILSEMLTHGYRVDVVLTQPDRPAGRGLQSTASPVKQLALDRDLLLLQPERLKPRKTTDAQTTDECRAIEETQKVLEALHLDVLVVVAYGLILPSWLLTLPRLGCINIHASLLPRWRGAAPIHRAIEVGDAYSGVTIMQMDDGLDTGAILSMQSVPIHSHMNTGDLHDVLADTGARLLRDVLDNLEQFQAQAQQQPVEGVTYAEKIRKEEACLDWTMTAEELDRKVRAFNPFPGANLPFGDERLKVWKASILKDFPGASGRVPGDIIAQGEEGIDVQTAEGILRITEIQRPGGKRLAVKDFLKGTKL